MKTDNCIPLIYLPIQHGYSASGGNFTLTEDDSIRGSSGNFAVNAAVDFDGTNDYLSTSLDLKESNDTKYSHKFLVLFKKEPSKKKIKKLCKKYGIVAFSLVDY